MKIKENILKIKSEIEKNVVPTKEDRIHFKKIANEIIEIIKSNIDDDIDVCICGSFAKDTWLKDSKELDIFLRFPINYKENEMIEYLKKRLKNVLNLSVRHATRDYLFGKYNGIEIEIIPVYKIDTPEKAKHIMDYSYFHTIYVNNSLSDKQKNEVRILKKYLKMTNCYGAESHIEGFSGYVCELLIDYFKTFENTILNLLKTKQPIFIDKKGYYKNPMDARNRLKEKVGNCPLIVIDPVTKNRNASKALSYTTFEKFILKTLINISVLPIVGTKKLILSIDNSNDELILASKLRSITGKIVNTLNSNNFFVLFYDVYIKEKIYSEINYFDMDFNNVIMKQGPMIWMLDSMINFINKNKNNIYGYVSKNQRLYFFIRRNKNIKYILSNSLKLLKSNSKFSDVIKSMVIDYEG